jgi:RimJ/RimL family protein N-acetyltransferase
MQPLDTPRLTIRNFTVDDWRALQELVVAHSATPVAQYDHAWPTDDEGVRGACAWFASGDAFLAVCLRATGRLIGYVALNPTDEADVYNLGYLLHPDLRGQGLGTELGRTAVNYAFGALGAARLVSGTAAANEPSCRLLRRLGFVEVAAPKRGRELASFGEDEADALEGLRFELARSQDRLPSARAS